MGTLNDVTVSNTDWLDANAATSTPVGQTILVQLKAGYALVQIKSVKPVAADMNGVLLEPLLIYPIQGTTPIWIKALNTAVTANIQQGD